MTITHPFDLTIPNSLTVYPPYNLSDYLVRPSEKTNLTYGYILDKGMFLTEQSEKLCKFRYKGITLEMNNSNKLVIQIDNEFVFKGTVRTAEEFETLLRQLDIRFN